MSRKRKVYWTAAIAFVVVVAFVIAVGWYASEQVIHPVENQSPYLPEHYNLPLEKVHCQSRDGLRLAGWFVSGTNGATVVLVHGRGGYKDWMLPHADYLHKAGFSALLFDYRYRGESEGDAQTLGAKESWDIQSAVDYLRTRPDVDPERIGVQGNSMGAASAILAASEKPEIKGVIAQIPFTSINDILCHSFKYQFGLPCFPFAYVTKWISELRLGVDLDKVAPVEVIGGISPRPVFLIDEGMDTVFPCNSVETLYVAAGDPKTFWMVPDATHGKGWETAPEEYERRVLAFWRQTFGIAHPELPSDSKMKTNASAERSNQASASAGHPTPPLVFIHGFKGSTLLEPKGSLRWLTWWQALGFASPDLSLSLHWNGDVQRRDDLVVGAPLRTVARRDIYDSFLDRASRSRLPFYPFAYDWRRDNLPNTQRFVEFLETISEQNGDAKVQVVAHSMGGLISFAALNQRPDLFHSVLFAGVPFGHSVSFLDDMHAGTATGLNRRILSPNVLFTFPSRYCFFPVDAQQSGLVELDGNRITHDWYSANDWERHKLGIFGAVDSSQVTEEQRSHLRNALRRARDFRRLLVCKKEESFKYPPIAVLASDTRLTLSTVIRHGPHAVRGWDFQTAPREPGDGRVEFAKAMPPEGVPYTVHKTVREHGELLKDTGQVWAILERLCVGDQLSQ